MQSPATVSQQRSPYPRQPIIAIDGPAGAGKSTVTRSIGQKLGLLYLDTGAMYRAVTWLVLDRGIPIDDETAIERLVSQCDIELSDHADQYQVRINGQEVTQAIRSTNVTANVSAIAAQTAVRQTLMKKQKNYGQKGGIIAEGRDIGTHIFPEADLKIFLTASVRERAKRRQKDLQDRGQGNISLEQLEQAIRERDRKDSNRKIAPLRQATDAIEIQTDEISISDVVEKIIALYQKKIFPSTLSEPN